MKNDRGLSGRFEHGCTETFASGYLLQYPLSTYKYPKVLQYLSVPVTYWYQGTFSGTLASVHALGFIHSRNTL